MFFGFKNGEVNVNCKNLEICIFSAFYFINENTFIKVSIKRIKTAINFSFSSYFETWLVAQTRCQTGYFGRYCRARCFYPYYGKSVCYNVIVASQCAMWLLDVMLLIKVWRKSLPKEIIHCYFKVLLWFPVY